jgi:hypothetical protein
MEQIENIKTQVQAYFDKYASNYIPNFYYLSNEDKQHIVNIGTSIICTRHEIGYAGGSFVQSVVNNDLRGAIANADGTNVNALKFYCMMMYNMSVNLK